MKYMNISILSVVDETIAQFADMKDRTVVINGVSKAYAMTGWRIGYMGAPLWLIKACDKLQGQTTTGATTISQKAATAALTGDQSCVGEMNNAFKRRKGLVVKLVREIPHLKVYDPDGAVLCISPGKCRLWEIDKWKENLQLQ